MKTQFNPENKKQLTYGDVLGPAMKITDQADADQYKEAYINHMVAAGQTRKEAEHIANANFGYYAGYYDSETRERVERLFKCSHPIFGSIKDNGTPTAEEAFELGKKAAR